MKITNFSLIFLIIFVCVCSIFELETREYTIISKQKIKYNNYLDNAIDDAMEVLVETSNNTLSTFNKNKCINQFFSSLYANFGITQNKLGQELLQLYIPVILITDIDGYYILYNENYIEKDELQLRQRWTEKRPYSFEYNNYIYSFRLDDYLKILDKTTNKVYDGTYYDLYKLYNTSFLSSYKKFDEIRKNSIIETLMEDMNYYINENNTIAKQYGIQYQFSLPYISTQDWYRTIDDISFLAIFQGYPLSIGNQTFNRYGIGATRTTKNTAYYIQPSNRVLYYHKFSCTLLNNFSQYYNSKIECALAGAYECSICKP